MASSYAPVIDWISLEGNRREWIFRLPKGKVHELSLDSRTVTGVKGDEGQSTDIIRLGRDVFTQETATLFALHAYGMPITTISEADSRYRPLASGETPTLSGLPRPDRAGEPVTRLLAPTEEDLDIINRLHAVEKQTTSTIKIYERYVVNDYPSRNMLWFTEGALGKFAQDFEQGRSRLLYHNKEKVVGRTFAASVVRSTVRGIDANWVKVKEYVPITKGNEETIAQLGAGTYAFDSIGFSGGYMDVKEVKRKDRDGSDRTYYYLSIDYRPEELPPLEAGEVSYVFIGAIYGAGNNKQEAANHHGSVTAASSGATGGKLKKQGSSTWKVEGHIKKLPMGGQRWQIFP